MDDLYQPISRNDILRTLVTKYGGVETIRYFLADAISDLNSMGIGMAENNPMLASKHYESLYEALKNIQMLLERKENKPSIEKEVKDNSSVI